MSNGISIHALRGEGDPSGVRFAVNCKDFNPRPPWGGRLGARLETRPSSRISIHALRGEGDM